MENKREIFALVGAASILFAALTHNLLSFERMGVELGVGFRGLSVCSGGNCASTNEHTSLGSFAFFLGLLSAAALGGAVAMDRMQDDDRLWRPAGLFSALFVLAAIGWYVDLSMGGASMGIGLWLGVPGAGAAAFVCLAGEAGDQMAPFERIENRKENIEADLAKYYKNPAAAPAPQGAAEAHAAPAPQAVAAPRAVAAPHAVAAPGAPAHEMVRLRFVAASAVISNEGLVATFDDGRTQRLRFGEVKQLVARRLPLELGHGPVLLLDLVANDAPDQPIRILPATQVNYRDLADGASLDANVNARGLVKLVVSQQPALQMDAGSKLFAEGEGTGLPFKSVDHFWEYDGRYPV